MQPSSRPAVLGDPSRIPRRFEVLDVVGEGGFGCVYSAHDHETGQTVALKVLQHPTPAAILRLKREFRAAHHLRHPNLVVQHGLHEADGLWYLSMELVEGVHLLEWVRPRGRANALSEQRLRSAFAQVADGLLALHGAGLVHRDIKPDNLIVRHDGRVAIVDFGLLRLAEASKKFTLGTVGTVRYMAPEQAKGVEVTPAADWYALGTCLYEALAGRPPFDGGPGEILRKKQQAAPEPPSSHDSTVPKDLDALCAAMLRIEPLDRPIGAAIHGLLGGTPAKGANTRMQRRPANMVGRDESIQELFDGLAASYTTPQVVEVCGEPGIGKSTLVTAFCELARQRDPALCVFRTRCHERELVSHPILDGLVDDVVCHLRSRPPAEVRRLLPEGVDGIAGTFKAFGSLNLQPTPTVEPSEPPKPLPGVQQLLAALCAEGPIVVVVEDAHWAAPSAVERFFSLLGGPEAPELLVLFVRRDEGRSCQATANEVGLPFQSVRLGELPSEPALTLARRLGLGGAAAEQAARESSGHPMLLELLADQADTPEHQEVSLHSAMRRALAGLSAFERTVVAAVALAEAPCDPAVLAVALKCPRPKVELAASLMQPSRLLVSRQGGRLTVGHSRWAGAVLEGVSEAERLSMHRQLAHAMSDDPEVPAEVLARHWEAGGEPSRAAAAYATAAERAFAQGRYAEASQAWASASQQSSRSGTGAGDKPYTALCAAALSCGGLHREAAELRATEGPVAIEVARAVEDMVHVDRPAGVQLLSSLTSGLPRGHWRVRMGLGASRWVAPTIPMSPGPGPEGAPSTSTTGTTLRWALFTDGWRAADVGLSLAAEATEDQAATLRALGHEGARTAWETGSPQGDLAQSLIARARQGAAWTGSPEIRAEVRLFEAAVFASEGRGTETLGAAREAESLFVEAAATGAHAALGRTAAQALGLRALYRSGQFEEHAATLAVLQDRAGCTPTLHNAAWTLIGCGALQALRRDRVDEASALIRDARAWCDEEDRGLVWLGALETEVEVALYGGQAEGGLAVLDGAWKDLTNSRWWLVPECRARFLWLRARCLLRRGACASVDGLGGHRRQMQVRALVRKLQKTGCTGPRYAVLLRAVAASERGSWSALRSAVAELPQDGIPGDYLASMACECLRNRKSVYYLYRSEDAAELEELRRRGWLQPGDVLRSVLATPAKGLNAARG